jgi:AAA+ ATPase superfamily predicted ATPase
MDNPFIFGKVVGGRQFLNREAETATISRTLQSGQNIICYSPRRYGKTSLMMRVKDDLEARGRLVFFIDFFRVTSLEDLYNLYATSIASAIRSPIKSLISILQTILPTINPRIVFKGHDAPSVEISVPLPVLLKPATLRELFDALEIYCTKKQKSGTVIFDEFQEIASIKDGKIIEREMRSAFQHHKRISYAFLGSKQHLLESIFKDKNRPFYNFGRHFELEVIDADHWRKYIAGRMGSHCPESLIDRILGISENHPYYTQMLCHYLWEQASDTRKAIDSTMIEQVADDIVRRDSMLYLEMWDELGIRERHLAKAIAVEETRSIYEQGFILKHSLGTASSVQKAADTLFNLNYLRKSPAAHIVFINPFFKRWIMQNIVLSN